METEEVALPSVFISYRREDSAGYAGRLCEHLSRLFGAERIFMDVEDIAPGEDFVAALETRISGCHVVLAVIGPHWLSTLQSRSAPEDFVRHEVGAALKRGVTVIPVLVGGASMPRSRDLPKPLAALSRRQALELRDGRFEDDLNALVNVLRKAGEASPAQDPAPPDLNGSWIAEMQKAGQPSFQISLDLVAMAGRLLGTVSYPTGQGAIHDGSVKGTQIAFTTTHVPQFESNPATIQFTGEVLGSEVRLVSVDDNGIARGTARKKAS